MEITPDPREIRAEWYSEAGHGRTTQDLYTSFLDAWFAHIGPRVWHTGPTDVLDWLRSYGDNAAHASRETRTTAVRGFYAYATALGIVRTNPTDAIVRVVVHSDQPRSLTHAQATALYVATLVWLSLIHI